MSASPILKFPTVDGSAKIRPRDVFAAIYQGCDGLTELRAIPLDKQTHSAQVAFFKPEDADAIGAWIGARRAKVIYQGLYFGVATRLNHTSGTTANLQHLGALYCDVDFKAHPEAAAREELAGFLLPPSIVIHSGGGLHCYWLLREPIDLAADNPKAILRRLALFLGGDLSVAEPAHILRIPETFNRKPEYAPSPVVTIERFTADARYNLSDFEELLPLEASAAKGAQNETAERFQVNEHAKPGERNDVMYRLARSLKSTGNSRDSIHAAVSTLNERFAEPHPPSEVDRVVDWAMQQPDRPGFEPHENGTATDFDTLVEREYQRERARFEARKRIEQDRRGAIIIPTAPTLRELLARPETPLAFRMQGWQPCDSRVMLAAQFKAGKTTIIGNLLRSLVDGDPWLGRATVTPVPGSIMLVDTEMHQSQLEVWLRAQGIKRDDYIRPFSLKGRMGTFNLLDDATRAGWADRFREYGACYVVLDCLRPVLDALGLDEHSEAGRFLVQFDALLTEAGVTEACMVHHMGHTGDRARGDSRLRDWPDVEWRVTRQSEEPSSSRFISAYGRDVDVPEGALLYDPSGRRLTYIEGSRQEAQRTIKAREALNDILRELRRDGAATLNQRAILDALKGRHTEDSVLAGLELGVQDEILAQTREKHNAKVYRRTESSTRPAETSEAGKSVQQNTSAELADRSSATGSENASAARGIGATESRVLQFCKPPASETAKPVPQFSAPLGGRGTTKPTGTRETETTISVSGDTVGGTHGDTYDGVGL